MQSNRLVAVCYQADDEYAAMNTEVLGADASLVFVQRLPEDQRAAAMADAEVLIGWNPGRELPGGRPRRRVLA